MAAEIYYSPFIPAFSPNGLPVAGSKLYFFYAGTENLAPIYADVGMTTILPNPVVSNLAARYPNIYLDADTGYRVRETGPDDVPLGSDIDPYIPGQALRGPPGASDNSYDNLLVFKASSVVEGKASLFGGAVPVPGDYFWTLGDFTGQADDNYIIKADSTSLSVGAWVRSGADGASYKAPVTGSIRRSVASKLAETVSSKDMNAVGDGVADDTLALQALFTGMATTGRVDLLPGTYKVTKPLVIPPGIILGGEVTFDFSSANPSDFPSLTPCVLIQGPVKTQIANLSTDLAIGDRIFTFSTGHGLVLGDSFQLVGTVDGAGNGYQPYYRKGEIFDVARVVNSTTIEVQNACRDSYAAAGVQVWKRPRDKASFVQGCANLKIIAPDSISYGLRCISLTRSSLNNLYVGGGRVAAVEMIDCYDMFGDNIYTRQLSNASDGYGVSVIYCQGVKFDGGFYGFFNGIATGGGSTATTGLIGMNRDIHVSGVFGSDPVSGLAGANYHGNTEYSSYTGVFTNGVVLAGNNNEAHGTFIGRSGRPAVLMTEMHGHSFTITGVARTRGADLGTTFGAINMGSSGNDYGTYARYGGVTQINLELYCANAPRPVYWRTTALARTDVQLRIAVKLMEVNATTCLFVLNKVSGNDMPAIDFTGFSQIDYTSALTWSLDTGTKVRGLQATTSVAVTGSAASATAAATFGFVFPRAPTVTTSLQSASFAGSSPLVTGANSVTATGATITVATTDKVSQSINSTVSVVAALDQK